MKRLLVQTVLGCVLVACGGDGGAHGCGPFPAATSSRVAVGTTARIRTGVGGFPSFLDFDGALWWPPTGRATDYLPSGTVVDVTLEQQPVDGAYGDGAATVRQPDGSTTQYVAGPGCA